MDQNSHPRGKTWRYYFYHSYWIWKPRRDYWWKYLQASRPHRCLFIVCPRCSGQYCHQSLLLWCICKCVQSVKSTEYLHSYIRKSQANAAIAITNTSSWSGVVMLRSDIHQLFDGYFIAINPDVCTQPYISTKLQWLMIILGQLQ